MTITCIHRVGTHFKHNNLEKCFFLHVNTKTLNYGIQGNYLTAEFGVYYSDQITFDQLAKNFLEREVYKQPNFKYFVEDWLLDLEAYGGVVTIYISIFLHNYFYVGRSAKK